MNVVWVDRCLVVAAYQIDLRKYLDTVKICREVLDMGNGIQVGCFNLIKTAIATTEPPASR